jgi:hypothetical protein
MRDLRRGALLAGQPHGHPRDPGGRQCRPGRR